MAYNFNEQSNQDLVKGPQWLKKGYGVYSLGKPPVDDAWDNNYQAYADNPAGTGALPAYKRSNSLGQFEINNGHLMVDTALTINATAVPATPTLATNGTAGATTYTYKVVGRAGTLQAPSATKSITTGNATLSAANSITITWTPTPGFLIYDIYRTVGGSTQGLIGSVAAAFGPNVSTPTLTFTDTGITGDGSTSPTTNTTGGVAGDVNVYGNINLNALATPATPLVKSNGSGAVTWGYKIVARCGSPTTPSGHTAASTEGTTSTGVATITGSANGNVITWQPVPGAVAYDIYRTTAGTSPSSTGKIATVSATNTYTDAGAAGDSSVAPTTNNTGILNAGGSGDTIQLAQINDTNGNLEISFTATASAVNGLNLTNAATLNAPVLASTGTDSNVGFTLSTKGTGALTLNTGTAAGTIVVGNAAGTGTITVGSSSAAQSVLIGNGAGAATVSLANAGTAGNTVNVAGAATAAAATDTINIATGNAAATGFKLVNIATGTPGTSGNNRVIIGGGTTTGATVNAAFSSYQAVNFIGTESGANNALVATLNDAAGNPVTVAAGLRIALKLGHTLQAGANTLNLNSSGAKSIFSAHTATSNLANTYAVGSIADLFFDGTNWQMMGQ